MLYILVILSLFFKPSVQNGGNEFDLCAAMLEKRERKQRWDFQATYKEWETRICSKNEFSFAFCRQISL